jgi:anti-sigma B factor antagonist
VGRIEPTIVRVSGDVDFTGRSAFREQLIAVLEAEHGIVDCSEATYLDSSAISELLACNKQRLRAGRTPLRIVVGTSVARIFEVAGVDQVLELYPTLEDVATR